MRLDEEYCLSEYADLGRLGDNEKVHIVRNQVNGVIGVRKYVALDLEEIYLFLRKIRMRIYQRSMSVFRPIRI